MLPHDTLSKFHCVADIRVHLNLPARDEGKLYVSNGEILIVIDDDPGVFVLVDSPLPAMAKKVLFPINRRDNWISVDMPLPPSIPCFVCGGIGKLTVCERCHGEGVVDSDDETEEVPCPKCLGRAEWPDANGKACWKCDGSGEGILAIPVANTHFQRRYLSLLQDLPGPVTLSVGAIHSDVAFFGFADGYGALMPVRP